MNKIFKKIFLGSIGIISVITPLTVVSLSMNRNLEQNVVKPFIFQNKEFKSKDDALEYFLSNQRNNIEKHNVIGSIADSTIDSKYNILNKNLLPDYDPSNIDFAYKASNGQLVQNINLARGSYARPQDSQLKYTFPGNLNYPYPTLDEAESAAKKYVQDEIIPVVKIQLPEDNSPFVRLNPSNVDDVKNLKDELTGIINDKNTTSTNIKNHGWDIEYFNNSEKINNDILTDSEFNNFLAKYITSNNNRDMFTNFNANIVKKIPNYYDEQHNQIVSSIDIEDNENDRLYKCYDDKDSNLWPYKTNWVSEKIDLQVGDVDVCTYNFKEYQHDYKGLNYVKAETPKSNSFSVNDPIKITKKNGSWKINLMNTNDAPKGNEDINFLNDIDINDLNFNIKTQKFIDFSDSELVVKQWSRSNTGVLASCYIHDNVSKEIDNVKVITKLIRPKDKDEVNKKMKIYLASQNSNLIRELSYNGKPMFKLEGGKGSFSLENISNNSNDKDLIPDFLDRLIKSNSGYEISLDKFKNELSKKSYNDEISRSNLIKQSGKVNVGNNKGEIYKQYLHALCNLIGNTNISGSDSKNETIKVLKPDDMLFFKNEDFKFKNNLVYANNFNPSIFGTTKCETFPELNDYASIERNRKTYAPSISKCWVFYDSFGSSIYQIDNSGTYNNVIFDDIKLMKQNIINHEGMHIDDEMVFVKTPMGTILIKNQIHNIYSFKYEHRVIYFRDFESLRSYALSIINKYGV